MPSVKPFISQDFQHKIASQYSRNDISVYILFVYINGIKFYICRGTDNMEKQNKYTYYPRKNWCISDTAILFAKTLLSDDGSSYFMPNNYKYNLNLLNKVILIGTVYYNMFIGHINLLLSVQIRICCLSCYLLLQFWSYSFSFL